MRLRYRIDVRSLVFLVLSAAACARGGADTPGMDAPHGGPHDDAPPMDIDAEPHHDAFEFMDAPMASGTHLVINEVDYDNVSTDSSEYVEIFNPSGGAISLANVSLMLVNGSSSPSPVYDTIDLSAQGSLAAGAYLVISNASVSPMGSAMHVIPSGWSANAVQNGNPDGMALVDTQAKTVIDALSYGGSITAAQLTNFTGTTSLVEGTATAAVDSNSATGSLCRKPSGQDTDDASVDWTFCTSLSPGVANP